MTRLPGGNECPAHPRALGDVRRSHRITAIALTAVTTAALALAATTATAATTTLKPGPVGPERGSEFERGAGDRRL